MSEGFFFVFSKLVWTLISPGNLLVLLGVGAWICLALGWVRPGRRLLSVCALMLLIIGFVPVGEWLLMPLEKRFATNAALPAEVDGIIVLGGAISPSRSLRWNQVELTENAERLISFQYLAGLYPDAQLVFSGGSGELTGQDLSEADFAEDFFVQTGLSPRPILYERESRNTAENVGHSKGLVDPQQSADWILVTSAFHMPRAIGVFCRQQWPVIPYPVDHYTEPDHPLRVRLNFADNLQILHTGLREWVGLVAYRLVGHSDQLLPGNDNYCGVESSSSS